MTEDESGLLRALHERPLDDALPLVCADWLDDHGQPDRAELLRLTRRLRDALGGEERAGIEGRVRSLLEAGSLPCVPTLSNSIGMRLALVREGRFWMGSPDDEQEALGNETRHEVEIAQPFWMGVFPVTQGEYKAVGQNPSYHVRREVRKITKDFPVEQVSWEEAVEFCRRLSARAEEATLGRAYRLPTEPEWEYACRGGLSSGAYHFGGVIDGRRANFHGSGLLRTSKVGSYSPNPFGLFDMHGNVWEWCSGEYGDYPIGRVKEPVESGEVIRVYRGGAWDAPADECRSAFRGNHYPGTRDYNLGFRVALTFKEG